jgi:hypothetical protein
MALNINVASTVLLSTEVYSTADENRVFAMETTISDKENIRLLIDEAAANIVAHVQKRGIIQK